MTAQQRANGSISLSEATAVSLGTIIGAGIFILSGSAIRLAGPSAVISFILTAFCALLIALNTSELSSRIQKRGAIYSFTREALGDFYGFLVGWMRIASYIVGGAAVALGFSSYLLRILGLDLWLEPYLAGLLIAFLTALNLAGVRPTVRMEFILVSFNVAALITFIATGLLLSKHPISSLQPFAPFGARGIAQAATLAFFAYTGFNTVATMTPEIKDAQRNVPRAILSSLAISTMLYIGVVFSMLLMADWREYSFSASPLKDALSSVSAPAVIVGFVSIAAIAATVTVTTSMILAGSRTLYQMSADGLPQRVQQNRSGSRGT